MHILFYRDLPPSLKLSSSHHLHHHHHSDHGCVCLCLFTSLITQTNGWPQYTILPHIRTYMPNRKWHGTFNSNKWIAQLPFSALITTHSIAIPCILSDNYLHINGFGCNAYFRLVLVIIVFAFVSTQILLASHPTSLVFRITLVIPFCMCMCASLLHKVNGNCDRRPHMHNTHSTQSPHSPSHTRHRPFKTCKLLEIAPIFVLFVLAPCWSFYYIAYLFI